MVLLVSKSLSINITNARTKGACSFRTKEWMDERTEGLHGTYLGNLSVRLELDLRLDWLDDVSFDHGRVVPVHPNKKEMNREAGADVSEAAWIRVISKPFRSVSSWFNRRDSNSHIVCHNGVVRVLDMVGLDRERLVQARAVHGRRRSNFKK